MAARSGIKFGQHLKELRIHCCQTSVESQGLREFVNKFYPEVKSHNPKLPILIRECSGVKPRIWARFEFGKERSLEASNKSPDDVMTELVKLVETGDK